MRNDFLGINSDLEWDKPKTWKGSAQGNYIKTKDGRFTISKALHKDVPKYTAWDRKKISQVHGPHPEHPNMDCKLVSSDNGWLGIFFFLEEAVRVCEMQLQSIESVNAP